MYTNHPVTYIDFLIPLYLNKIDINSYMKKKLKSNTQRIFLKWEDITIEVKITFYKKVQKHHGYNENINAIFLYAFTYK